MQRSLCSLLLFFALIAMASAQHFVGDWDIMAGHGKDKNLLVAEDNPISLRIHAVPGQPHKYKFRLKVANSFMGTITTGKSEKSGDKISVHVSGLGSTKMMPPAKFKSAEDFVSTALPKISLMEVKSGNLFLIGKDVMIRCKPQETGTN